jgi:hypothetical protein
MSAQLTHEVTQATTATPTTSPIASTGAGRLHGAWHRIRATVAEMNYATRRVAELQAPWIVDEQWHSR